MNRAIRRLFREWKEELARNWQRLNTFMRIVLGVVLAMAMVWSARRWVLDPLQLRLAQIREENAVIDMPDGIIRPENDVEIQENKLRAENLRKSLGASRQRVHDAAAVVVVVSPAAKVEVVTAMGQLMSRYHLLLRKHEEVELEENEKYPVPVSRHAYSVTGSFRSMHGFLHALNTFDYLSWFDAFEVQVVTHENGRERRIGGQLCLQLDFECTFYYYEGGHES